MYQPTSLRVPELEIQHLLAEALARIPTQCVGSFMGPYPFVPDCLTDAHVVKLQVVGLLPSQQIALHVDAPITGTRYHVPLQTNARCLSFTEAEDGVLYCHKLYTGEVYTMDPTQPHGAVNWGDTIRLHLMIDVEL